MKPVWAFVLFTIAFCGCDKTASQKSDNERLETRISALEENLSKIRALSETNSIMTQSNFLNAFATNQEAIDKITQQLAFENNRIEFMQTVLSNLINTINQGGAPANQQTNLQAQVQIPSAVLDQIKAAAIQQFPNNLNRQNDMIKQETDAWYKLNQ